MNFLPKKMLFFLVSTSLLFSQLILCSWKSFTKMLMHDPLALWINRKITHRLAIKEGLYNISSDTWWETQYCPLVKNLNPQKQAQEFIAILNLRNAKPQFTNQPFMLGLSSSHYQYEGHIAGASFDRWARLLKKPLSSDEGIDFWNNYKQIIDDLASINANTFRTSISWERIQPNGPDSWDQEAINHYKEIFKYMKSKGIEPLIVLHHYTIPQWFEDTVSTDNKGKRHETPFLGGFTKEDNITYFVAFAKRMYQELGDTVTYWSTCNLGYEFKAYRENQLAPGILYYIARIFYDIDPKLRSMAPFVTAYNYMNNIDASTKVDRTNLPKVDHQLLYTVYKQLSDNPNALDDATFANKEFVIDFAKRVNALAKKETLQMPLLVKKNILLAHVHIYKAFNNEYKTMRKTNKSIQKPIIGIQTTVHPIVPEGNAQSYIVAAVGNWMMNHGLYSFFTKNRFETFIPGKVNLDAYLKDANKSLDFIGINVYDRSIATSMKSKPYKETGEGKQTNTEKVYCPQAIAAAVQEVNKRLVQPLHKKTGHTIPIFITENGIAAVSNEQRNAYFASTLFTIKKLVELGYPIIGYTPWASHDNKGWAHKYENEGGYGIFAQPGILKDPEHNYFALFCKEFGELEQQNH